MAKMNEEQCVVDSCATGCFLNGYLSFWLAQASYWISRDFHDEIVRAGLTFAEWRVLASLHGSKGETIGTLCRLAQIKQPTLSKLVQRLEAEKLVTRRAAENDQRQTLVVSTAKGQTCIDDLVGKAQAHQQEVLHSFGEANTRKLIRTLKELVREHENSGLFDADSSPRFPRLRP